jgi:DNA-binding transcriptional regulator YdaS (Cro superfamily)
MITLPELHWNALSSAEYAKAVEEIARWCLVARGRQSYLAKRMNVSPGTVNHWISGKRPMSLEQWIAIKRIIRKKP